MGRGESLPPAKIRGNKNHGRSRNGTAKWTANSIPYQVKITFMKAMRSQSDRLPYHRDQRREFYGQWNRHPLNGVNHHDYSPTEGRVVTYDQMKADVVLMKRYNINALRLLPLSCR